MINNTTELAAGIIAVVEAIKNIDTKNYVKGWITFAIALVLGAVAGNWHLLGTPDILSGIFTAATAVGVHTVVSAWGSNNTTP